MTAEKELEKWAKWLQILSSILGGGGIISFLITFSTLEFCQRIFLAIIIVTGTLTLFISSRLLIKAKSSRVIEVPNQSSSSTIKYLAKNARGLLIGELLFALVCIFGSILFAFPESTNTLTVCSTPTSTTTPTFTSTPAPTPSITPTQTPDCITIQLDLNVVNASIEVIIDGSLTFKGNTVDGTFEVCIPNSYNKKEIELTIKADNYIPSTTRLVAKPGLPPQNFNLEPSCSINNLGWVEYQNDSLGSIINASPVIESNCALKTSFDLKRYGWAAIYKKLQPNVLLESQGIRFTYSGTGAANTIEFKLFEKDANGVETLFYAEWDGATSTAGKNITKEIYYADLICKPNGSRCLTGAEIINLELVDRIDFSISNKPNQLPGIGEVTIESIQIIP